MPTLKYLVTRAHQNSVTKGFWDQQVTGQRHQHSNPRAVEETIPEKLCLIHSEVSEALEDYRERSMVTRLAGGPKGDKPIGFPSELADVFIRLADLCGALGIDLEREVEMKMAYNESRPHMHGKRC